VPSCVGVDGSVTRGKLHGKFGQKKGQDRVQPVMPSNSDNLPRTNEGSFMYCSVPNYTVNREPKFLYWAALEKKVGSDLPPPLRHALRANNRDRT
jgi:hypothetical protein